MHIEIRNIHKSFGKVHANNDISLIIQSGEILGVLGENGAGKTTLMKIIAGLLIPDSGEILINDQAVNFTSADEALAAGIGMLSQDPLDFPVMTIFDNLYLGQKTGFFIKKKEFKEKITETQTSLGFNFDLADSVADLSMGERQQLEILRLMIYGSDLIILDEPTTGISLQQKTQLFQLLKRLSQLGKSIILVTHKLADVNELCQRTIVLKQGKLVGEVALPCDSPALIEMMFGKHIEFQKINDVSRDTPNFTVQNFVIKDPRFISNPVDLTIQHGEIIGLAGMEGSGQKTFLRTIAGLEKPLDGCVNFGDGRMVGNGNYQFAEAGVYFMPAARMEEGLLQGMSLVEHFILAQENHQFLINDKESMHITQQRIKEFAIKGTPYSCAEELSGGNQQRLLLAMLKENARLLLLENPTRGLDIESTNWMWNKLHERCQKGASIIFASADIDELLRFSSRVLVFFGGKISQPYSIAELTSDKLGSLIGGEGWQQ
jgi:simple sugar transport system ATP-binding protein